MSTGSSMGLGLGLHRQEQGRAFPQNASLDPTCNVNFTRLKVPSFDATEKGSVASSRTSQSRNLAS